MMIRRTLLSAVVLACMGHAHAITIDVSTFADENGENTAACSLREAIKAANTSAAFGGCPAGKRDVPTKIQLEAGNYVLTLGELVPTYSMDILGALRTDTRTRDAVAGVYPARVALKTTLTAAPNARLFNTGISRSNFSLTNIVLKGGTAVNGGAIQAGGTVTLNQVEVRDATATGTGGAVYLAGTGSTLNATDTVFEGNTAGSGSAVMGMSCLDNLVLTTRGMTFERVSMINNGSANSQSIVDLCGIPTAAFNQITVAKNTTSSAADAAVFRMLDDGNARRTAAQSVITFLGMTLVENNSPSGLLYDNQPNIVALSSVLAFNKGLSCRYVGSTPLVSIKNVGVASSFLGGTDTNQDCQLAPLATGVTTTNKYANGAVRSDVLNDLADYGGYLKGYLPKGNAPAALLLVDAGSSVASCGSTDMRGMSRSSGSKNAVTNILQSPRCDMGAVELGQLTANDDEPRNNESYAAVNDRVITTITDQERAKLSNEDRATIERLEADLKTYQTEFKRVFRYRTSYVPVFENDNPHEVIPALPSSGTVLASTIVPLLSPSNANNYDVTVESLGSGIDVTSTSEGSTNVTPDLNTAPNVACAWNPVLRSVSIFRKDFSLTPTGMVDRCRYTIRYKADSSVVSSGIAQATISNMAPIAKDDQYTLAFGSKVLSLDLLANDSDEGDGPQGIPLDDAGQPITMTRNGVTYPKYYAFFDNPFLPANERVNIRIITAPTQGKLKFERQGYCPDNSEGQVETICYGGKATYTANNVFSPFNDSFTYVVLDGNLTASNTATVKIINTATTTEDTRKGGGSLGVFGLLGLFGLAAYRRRTIKVQ